MHVFSTLTVELLGLGARMSGNKREKQSILAEPKIVIVLDFADTSRSDSPTYSWPPLPAPQILASTGQKQNYINIKLKSTWSLPPSSSSPGQTPKLWHWATLTQHFSSLTPHAPSSQLRACTVIPTPSAGSRLISRLAVEDVNVSGANSALANNAGPAAPSAEEDEFSEQTFYLLRHLRRASWSSIAQEGAIEDFSRELLRTLGFQTKHALLYTRYTMPFLVSGQSLTAQADISLVGTDNGSILLLLHKEIPVLHESAARIDPVPQLVAAAIAAFVANNKARTGKGKAALKEMVFPAIVMHNSRPKFFTIPVTAALKRAVGCGASPDDVTHVSQCHVPSPYELACGMETPAFRIRALRYFIAFKALAESLWNNY